MTDLFPGALQYWARGFSSGLHKYNRLAELRKGKLKLFDFPQVKIDLSEIPWHEDGEGVMAHPSWMMWFHSLKWLDQLLADDSQRPETEAADVALALSIARQWCDWNADADASNSPAWDGHATGMRITTLVALSGKAGSEKWLYDAIKEHVEHLLLPENFDGHWNHGLVQSMGLLGAAVRLGDQAAVDIARDRIIETLNVMVDDEGAINEQATAYANYIHNLLTTIIGIWNHNELPGVVRIQEKVKKLERFIVHSLEPSGHFVQIGDSIRTRPDRFDNDQLEYVRTHGSKGTKPSQRIAVFKEGYVFGRSGWGETRPLSEESFYSLRFGPGRIIHGHNDHTSLTWYEKGRNLLVDAGHAGYAPGRYRDYLRSPAAHNMVILPDHRLNWAAVTTLTRHHEGTQASFFEVLDEPYHGVKRTRGLLAVDKGPMIVLDKTSGTRPNLHRQLWHLSPEFSLESLGEQDARFKSALGDMSLVFIRFQLAKEGHSQVTGVSFLQGCHDPIQGWVARRDGEQLPAPVIGFDVRTDCLSLLTAVLAVPEGESLGWSLREDGKLHVLRIHVGSTSYSIDVDSLSGTMKLRGPVDRL